MEIFVTLIVVIVAVIPIVAIGSQQPRYREMQRDRKGWVAYVGALFRDANTDIRAVNTYTSQEVKLNQFSRLRVPVKI